MHGLLTVEPVGGEDGPHRLERFPLGLCGLGIVGVRESVGPDGGCVETSALLDEAAVGLRQTERRRSVLCLQIGTSSKWAMLGSNQRPLPCEGSTMVCWRFLEFTKHLQIAKFLC